jgi:hypothetical protein
MPLPLRFIVTLMPETRCSHCGNPMVCMRLDLFLPEHLGRSEPFCVQCVEKAGELRSEVALTEFGPAKLPYRTRLRRQKRLSQQQEVDIAEELGARVQKSSGALSGSKGDVRRKGVVRVEAKYTEADSYRLELGELEKIGAECHGRERPVLVLDFKEKGTGKLRDRFAVVRFQDAKEMFNAAGQNR